MCGTAAARPVAPPTAAATPPSQPHSCGVRLGGWREVRRAAFSDLQGIETPACHPSNEQPTCERLSTRKRVRGGMGSGGRRGSWGMGEGEGGEGGRGRGEQEGRSGIREWGEWAEGGDDQQGEAMEWGSGNGGLGSGGTGRGADREGGGEKERQREPALALGRLRVAWVVAQCLHSLSWPTPTAICPPPQPMRARRILSRRHPSQTTPPLACPTSKEREESPEQTAPISPPLPCPALPPIEDKEKNSDKKTSISPLLSI